MNAWFDRLVNTSRLARGWDSFPVFDLLFHEDSVSAIVFNNEEYHDVEITFKQFSIHDKDKLKKVLGNDSIRRDLLRGIVPDEFFSCGVDIFPSSATDIMVECSCWGMSLICSEAAAVLYRLRDIFKNDPFLIFRLRGFDLKGIDLFPIKEIDDIFTSGTRFDEDLTFVIDSDLYSSIDNLLHDLKYMITNHDFNHKPCIDSLNLNGDYQITDNSFENPGDLISSLDNDIVDYAFELIGDYKILPEIFKIGDGRVYVRWIPYVNVDFDDFLEITFNENTISRQNQLITLISLIVDDLLDLYALENSFEEDMLYRSTVLDSKAKRELASDIARNMSFLDLPARDFRYELHIHEDDFYFSFDFKMPDDLESSRYAYPISNLFRHFKIYWDLNNTLILNSKQFLKFTNKIEKYLKCLNTEVIKSFNLYNAGFKIKLTSKDLSSPEWMVDIGNQLLTVDEFKSIKVTREGLAKIRNDYYFIDSVKYESLKSDLMFLPGNLESFELLQIALLGRYRNLKFDIGDGFEHLIGNPENIGVPESLKGTLRPYQITGYSWLIQNIKSGFGSVLADDMGLGKTIQVLAAILYLKENNCLDGGDVLIIAPTTLITNWVNEIVKFTDLTYSVYHGTERKISSDADVILTSYGMVRSDEDVFKRRSWFLCVVDEAQNIKNPSSKQTRAVKNISSAHRIALTGTPIENRLLDYWSIFDFTNKGYLKSREKFKKEYANPIAKFPNSSLLKKLKLITKPFILRRLKTDKSIINDLPDKIVNDIYCDLTKKQLGLYDELVKSGLGNIQDKTGIKRKGDILKLITSLKQICNHPVQYLKKGKVNVKDSAKLELLIGIVENILDVDEKVIIFTQYVQMGEMIRDVLLKKFNREVLFLHGSLDRKQREKIITNFQNEDTHPILIATLKTGGVGLNLTSAQNVVHYDLWWNPAVENQATDRAYRIGQKKDVMVYRFITKGTLEEKIDLILKNKLKLANKTITSEETFITELDDEELKEILELRL